MFASPCVPCCPTTPSIVQIPGSSGIPGLDGPQGEEGPPGPESSLTVYSAFGTGEFEMPVDDTPVLLEVSPIPSIVLVDEGTYLLSGKGKFNADGATITTQILTALLQCVNNTIAPVPNSTETFEFIPSTTIDGTLCEITWQNIPYDAAAGDNIQIYGAISAALGAGVVNCVEGYIVALKVAPPA
jgi:hypothetical protein